MYVGGGEFTKELILELGFEEWVSCRHMEMGSGSLVLQAHRREDKRN